MSETPTTVEVEDDLGVWERPFPRVVRIEPAGACNLACSHCPTGTVKMSRGIMRAETFARILESVRAHLDAVKVVVMYHGGEPLLNKGFAGMVRQIKAAGVPFVKTVSNGMLLDERVISGLVASGLDALEVSLDGESAAQNDFVRRNVDAATVVGNLQRLIRYKRELGSSRPEIFISTTQFLRPEGSATPRESPPPPAWLTREFSVAAGDVAGFKCGWAMRWPHMEVLEDVYEVWPDPEDSAIRTSCDKADNTVTIRWDGEVVACCYDLTSRYPLGNVHREDLARIWNNRRYLALRGSIARGRFIPLCANCNTVKPGVYLTLRPEIRARFE